MCMKFGQSILVYFKTAQCNKMPIKGIKKAAYGDFLLAFKVLQTSIPIRIQTITPTTTMLPFRIIRIRGLSSSASIDV